MRSKDCPVVAICAYMLMDFPERIPHKCSECNPIIRESLEKIKHKIQVKEEQWWNDNGTTEI